MSKRFTLDDVRATYKVRDAWWTIFLVDPFASRLVVVVANRTRITPNQLTWCAALLGLGAAAAFWQATALWWVIGAVLFHLSFVIDCMDGKLARLTGNGSYFGIWLDFLFDRVRDLICAVALFGGLARATDNAGYWLLGMVFVSVNLFRYLDAAAIAKIRRLMEQDIEVACRTAGVDSAGSLRLDAYGDAENDATVGTTESALQTPLVRHTSWYPQLRDWLLRKRVRTHLFSGIEYQMAVFVVAPVVQAALPTAVAVITLVGALLLLSFEALLIGTLWLSTREVEPLLRRIRQHEPPPVTP